ncbi:MAG: hypothetical protein IMZ52_02725, partial [Actinobacteria bacterium]|nr:hypothetical protein [Actinomycetota bacterium]
MNKETILRGHFDADGITSIFLTSYHVENPKLEVWSGEFGDTTGLKTGDWMCDMHPIEGQEVPEGLNILDHHAIETYPIKRKYNLFSDTVPASLIAWRLFHEDIPKSQWWKVAVGVMGDGQPELIPYEIFQACPQLLNRIKTSAFWNDKTFEYTLNHWIAYKLVSSPINALLRVKAYDKAIKLISEAETPE